MKYAVCNELFGDIPWPDAFSLARECGYTGLEVAPFTLGQPGAVDAATRRRFVETAGEAGLEVVGLHWLLAKTEGLHLTTIQPSVREKTVAYLAYLTELCHDLGGRVMVLGSPQQRNFAAPMTHDQAMENAAWVLARLVPVLEKWNVQIAVEPLGPQEGNFLNHAAQAVELIERVGSEHVQLHLDVKAMSSEGMPIPEIIETYAPRMVHFHANDPNRLGPGMGAVDFAPIFRALRKVDYRGWVSVEVFDYTPGVETILRQSMDCMVRSARCA